MATVDIADVRTHLELNVGSLSSLPASHPLMRSRTQTLAPLALFQACVPIMSKGGKFIFMSSGASVIDRTIDKTDAAYGVSKVRLLSITIPTG